MSRIGTSSDGAKEKGIGILLMSVNALILPTLMCFFSAICMFKEDSCSDMGELIKINFKTFKYHLFGRYRKQHSGRKSFHEKLKYEMLFGK